ncbi:MAG: secondary thiamine-phosphate synthase enzyme YjbQ [Thiohalomonadales bacterium]
MVIQESFDIMTHGRGTYNVTNEVQSRVEQSGISTGICQVFLQHTSASIILCENADPSVRTDLETFMLHLVPDGDPMFNHVSEGQDDMPAHIRTILTQSTLSLPVKKGRCDLGIWQDMYLWEHRYQGHRRQLIVTIIGE